MASINEIRSWLQRGIKKRARYMIVGSDHFDYSYYPIFAFTEAEMLEELEDLESGSMASAKEVYDYSKPLGPQLESQRTWEV